MLNIFLRNHKQSFISKFIEEYLPFKNKFIGSFVYFGLPCYLLISGHLYITNLTFNNVHIKTIDIIFLYIALSSAWIGPFLVWYYDKKASIFIRKSIINIDVKKLNCTKIDNLFLRFILPVLIAIGITIILLLYYLCEQYILRIGFRGSDDPFYILTYPFIFSFSFIGCLLCAKIIKTIRLIYITSRLANIDIYIYHPDNTGGLSEYYSFINTTAILFIFGTLFIPILISIAYEVKLYNLLIYIVIAIYILLTAFCFFIPYYLIYSKAKERKSALINTLYDELKQFESIYFTLRNDEYNKYRQIYLDTKDCNISPMNFKNISYIITILIVPLAAAFLKEFLVSQIIKK